MRGVEYGLSAWDEMHRADFEGSPHLAADGQLTRCGLRDERGKKSTIDISRDAVRTALLSDHHVSRLDGDCHGVVDFQTHVLDGPFRDGRYEL